MTTTGTDSVRRWLPIVIAMSLVATFYLLLPPDSTFVGILSDGVRYLLMAEHIAGTDQTVTGAQSAFHGSVFPPIYPMVLATTGADPAYSARLTALMFAVAAIPFAAWARRELAMSHLSAALCVVAVWLSPFMLAAILSIHSESLFLVLVMAATLVSAFRPSPKTMITLGVIVGLAILTRTVGIALLPALVVYLWRARSGKLWRLLAVATPLLMVAAWEIYKRSTAIADVAYTANLAEALSSPLSWAMATVWANVLALKLVGEASQLWLLALLLGLLALPNLGRRLVQAKFDAIFVFAYLIIVFLWPFPEHMERFFIPLAPFVLVYGLLEVTHWRPSWSLSWLAALIIVAQLPGLWSFASRMQAAVPEALAEYRPTPQFLRANSDEEALITAERLHRVVIAARSVAQSVEPGQCVYASLYELVFYYSRVSTRPLQPVAEMTECRFVLAMALEADGPGFDPMYPIFEALEFEPLWVSTDSQGKAVASLLDLQPTTTGGSR